jgi:hypothetical protein
MPRLRASPVLFAHAVGFSPQEFFNLDETERKAAPPRRRRKSSQLPTRGLSGATWGTRSMGGAICGSGATYGRSGGGGGPRPHASKPRGGWSGGRLTVGGGDGGAEGDRWAWAGAVKARAARATKVYATEVLATEVLRMVVMGAPSQTVGTSLDNGHAALLAQLPSAPKH